MNFFGYEREPAGRKRARVLVDALTRLAKADHFRVLDIGCGLACSTRASAELYKNGIFIGVDLDESSIRAAQREAPANCQFFVGMASAAKGKFDAVLMQEVLEHTPNPKEVLESVRGMVALGGLLFLTVPNGFSPLEMMLRIVRDPKTGNLSPKIRKARALLFRSKSEQTLNVSGTGHLQYFSPGRIGRLLKEAGFEIRAVRNSNCGWGFGLFWFCFIRLFVAPSSSVFRALDSLDCALADYLPRWTAGGWYFICEKRSS